MRPELLLCLALALPAAAQPYHPTPLVVEAAPGTPAPLKRRIRTDAHRVLAVRGRGLTELRKWPNEPASPDVVDPARFAGALGQLCRRLRKDRQTAYAEAILTAAGQYQVDPFLAGALMYRMSRCKPYAKGEFGFGLGAIDPNMHRGRQADGAYAVQVLTEAGWQKGSVPLPLSLNRRGLKKPTDNLTAMVGLLAAHRAECPANDGAWGSVPHRHYVSHFIWGDRVHGAGPEDRVLQDRRRLLNYYDPVPIEPAAFYGDLPLVPPLDGAPRKVTSGMGDDRDGGRRRHKGIDFESDIGEPVRAIADGVVGMAGVDRKRGPTLAMTPEDARKVSPRRMGAGGLLVTVRHAGGLRSLYMHLDRYFVQKDQVVRAGEIIGEVGRSGIKRSNAHLHFEMRAEGRRLDPLRYLEPYVFGPSETYLGQRLARKQRRDRSRRWRDRNARKAKKKVKRR